MCGVGGGGGVLNITETNVLFSFFLKIELFKKVNSRTSNRFDVYSKLHNVPFKKRKENIQPLQVIPIKKKLNKQQ